VKKTLLLNANYEVLSFIIDRKALKLIMREGKCEVLSVWDDIICWGSGQINHPATLRLTKLIRRTFTKSNFCRQSVVKRDNHECQYCGEKLMPSQITIDHVIPRAQGGGNSFANCVVSCKECNNRKDRRTPEQAGMKLLRKPTYPIFSGHHTIYSSEARKPRPLGRG
jgi:HNH endonuclease